MSLIFEEHGFELLTRLRRMTTRIRFLVAKLNTVFAPSLVFLKKREDTRPMAKFLALLLLICFSMTSLASNDACCAEDTIDSSVAEVHHNEDRESGNESHSHDDTSQKCLRCTTCSNTSNMSGASLVLSNTPKAANLNALGIYSQFTSAHLSGLTRPPIA